MSIQVQSVEGSTGSRRARGGRKPRLDRPAGAVSAFETSIASIVSRGLNVAALCTIFGVVDEWLHGKLVQADLSALGTRTMRRSTSANAWTIDQIRMLITLWPTNLYSTSIAERVGRSPGSVRYKAKWLGLPSRDRAQLTRIAPKLLPGLLPVEWRPWNDADEIQLGEEHLRGVASISTAVRMCRPTHQVECRVYGLQLPPRTFMRNKLKMDYNPADPMLEPFRNKGWCYRKCAFSDNMFWSPKGGPRISDAAKKSKAYRDVMGVAGEADADWSGLDN